MPCYNGAAHIEQGMRSALAQSFGDIELIVVDDGSLDDSVRIIGGQGDPRIRLIQQSHQGVCAARNRGLAEARGSYVAFLDADDTWEPSFLERMLSALEADGNAVLAYCGWQNLGLPGGRGEPFVPPDYERPDKVETWLGGCRWPIHAVVAKRAAIEAAGGFDERYPTSEDYLLWLRVVVKHKIVLVPEVLAYYHHHEGQRATRDRARVAFNHWLVQRRFLEENPELRKRLGPRRVRELTHGELLRRGYECYWKRDLVAARAIFRHVMRYGYGGPRAWMYMLPALMPLAVHRRLLALRDGGRTMPHQ